MRVLGVDPGQKRIGLAISDPTATIAGPLTVLRHVSRVVNSAAIADLAAQHSVELIVVGQSLDEEGQPTLEGRQAARLAAEIQARSGLPVVLWDESFSTQEARAASIAMGMPARKRRKRGHSHLDELAAAIILQSFLDAHRDNPAAP